MKLQAASLFLIISSFAGGCWSQDDSECTASLPCVRFCCFDKEQCNFDISELPEARNVDGRFKIFQGQPCNRSYALQPELYPEDFWSFKPVSKFFWSQKSNFYLKLKFLTMYHLTIFRMDKFISVRGLFRLTNTACTKLEQVKRRGEC